MKNYDMNNNNFNLMSSYSVLSMQFISLTYLIFK